MEKIKNVFKSIWNFIKKYWFIFIAAISFALVFVFIRGNDRRRILRESADRIREYRQQSSKCGTSIVEAGREVVNAGERIESSEGIVKDLIDSNRSISESIGDARDGIHDLESAIHERLSSIRKDGE